MKKGQVWVETVIYTVIGLSLIGVVLALVTPKINEYRDRVAIEQAIESLNTIDIKINELTDSPGNVRVVYYSLKKGALEFDAINDSIVYRIDDSHVLYSESGLESSIGRIKVLSTEGQKRHKVQLKMEYDFNLDYAGNESARVFNSATTPYKLSFRNDGFDDSGRLRIFFSG